MWKFIFISNKTWLYLQLMVKFTWFNSQLENQNPLDLWLIRNGVFRGKACAGYALRSILFKKKNNNGDLRVNLWIIGVFNITTSCWCKILYLCKKDPIIEQNNYNQNFFVSDVCSLQNRIFSFSEIPHSHPALDPSKSESRLFQLVKLSC